nr:hypothetical protein [uncultured Carboxylicivirga sp.]
MNENKVPIVILTTISTESIEAILNSLDLQKYTDIWLLEKDESLSKWAAKHTLNVSNLNTLNKHKFVTSGNRIIELPSSFLYHSKHLFIYQNYISKDNYLCGAIYNLGKLINKKPHLLNKQLLELYYFFKSSEFIAISNENNISKKSNAWQIDSDFINTLNLKRNRLYSSFFQHLSQNKQQLTDNNAKPVKHSFKLYSLGDYLTLIKQKLYHPINKLNEAFAIFIEMIRFRLKQYKRKKANN